MANTNIPTSLTTSTQIPVDSKTYKNTLSDISNVTSEKAYTYYAGMIVTLASDNKQYQWKQIEVGKTSVSNTFTYPANHSVEGYDYSNKSFAFYEYKSDSGSVTPQPDNRTIYRTEMKNLPTPMLSQYRTMYGQIYDSKVVDSTPTPDNYKNENFNLVTLGTNTLSMLRGGTATVPNNENVLWIEYFPNSKGQISVMPPEDLLNADLNVLDTIVIQPIENNPVIKFPNLDINKPIDFIIPWEGEYIVKAPDNGVPIFSDNSGSIRIKIGDNTKLVFEDALALNTDVQLIGNGQVIVKPQTLPFISGKSEFKIQDIDLSLEDAILADVATNSKGSIVNTKIKLSNNNKSLLSATDSDITILNTDLDVTGLSVVPIINASGVTSVDLSNTNVSGIAQKIFTVSEGDSINSPKISLNNSNLDSLTATSLFAGVVNNDNIAAENLKVNNTLFSNTEVLENSVIGFKNTNSIVNGENTTGGGSGGDVTKAYVDNADSLLSNRISTLDGKIDTQIGNTNGRINELETRVVALENNGGGGTIELQQFNNRVEAHEALGPNKLFINTKDNHEDKNQWIVDFTIL